ncbi:hypothetical protein [Paracoccus sp. IB05]|uniref:hypothetical protein n=1 Tax=Paracoccus sp. IB05 TaxID=2779367 RepID=UPI0018E73747|nr:hypothetical protein [Paracoccus sp. IB05]MBJ2150324.1 hypothetical protein [Paracoccus sp. IB05]
MKRFLTILVVAVFAAVAMVGYRYVSWVMNWTSADTPFDEVGIDLHKYMPGFVQDWGCAQLFAEFGDKTLPPHGCRGKGGWPS